MEKEITIKTLNPVYCQITRGREFLKPCLSYKASVWLKGPYAKKEKTYRKTVIEKDGIILRGYLQRISDFCTRQHIGFQILNKEDYHLPMDQEPLLIGKGFKGKWEFQKDLIRACINLQQGVILAATGSGKTIIMMAFLSCYPSAKVLFLCNTHQPITQFKNGLSLLPFNPRNISVSTIQKFSRKDPEEYISKYDIILIDETHAVSSFDGMYAKVLRQSLAPVRLGFTATLPRTTQGKFALEGLVGPVIGTLSTQEGIDREVLAEPKLILKRLKINKAVKKLRNYEDVYNKGIVRNRILNKEIISETKSYMDQGKSVLILVLKIEHGENLVMMAKKLYGFNLIFAQGKTSAEVREKIRLLMQKKKIKAVVATAIFRQGLDIPSLDVVINACLLKSDIVTLQSLGRGLRRTEDKAKVILLDFFDASHPHLISHFGQRLTLYFEEGWL